MSWSSGKDSAYALYLIQRDLKFQVRGLLTTINSLFSRVAMHSTRKKLLEQQASAAGLPLWRVAIPHPCTNEIYERAMNGICVKAKRNGISHIAFGDIFLEDVRKYREKNLRKVGLKWLFPLWKRTDTRRLALEIIDAGIKARVICIDTNVMPSEMAGQDFDRDFLKELPRGVDPCAENGEFHTFCYDSPGFKHAVNLRLGRKKKSGRFLFIDMIPT